MITVLTCAICAAHASGGPGGPGGGPPLTYSLTTVSDPNQSNITGDSEFDVSASGDSGSAYASYQEEHSVEPT